VWCANCLDSGVSKWLPKWALTSIHWSHLQEGIRIPFRRYDPSVPFIRLSLFSISPLSLFPRETSLEDHPTRSFFRSVMPTSSGSYARKKGLRSHGPVDEQLWLATFRANVFLVESRARWFCPTAFCSTLYSQRVIDRGPVYVERENVL
jgi:hypothetical protein